MLLYSEVQDGYVVVGVGVGVVVVVVVTVVDAFSSVYVCYLVYAWIILWFGVLLCILIRLGDSVSDSVGHEVSGSVGGVWPA